MIGTAGIYVVTFGIFGFSSVVAVSPAWSSIVPGIFFERETNDKIVGQQVPVASWNPELAERSVHAVPQLARSAGVRQRIAPAARTITHRHSKPIGTCPVYPAFGRQNPAAVAFYAGHAETVRIRQQKPIPIAASARAVLPPIDSEIKVLGIVGHPNPLNASYFFPVIPMLIDPHSANPIAGIAVDGDLLAGGLRQFKGLLDCSVFRNCQFPLLSEIAHGLDSHSVSSRRQSVENRDAHIVSRRRKDYVLVFCGAHSDRRLWQRHADYLIHNRGAKVTCGKTIGSHSVHI